MEETEKKHSDDALVRAYALGHAHAKGRMTPTTHDWACAKRWFES